MRAGALSDGLSQSGVRRGDRVVIDLPNGPELIEALFGCFWGGYVAVPVNWHLAPAEVGYIAEHCGARAVIVEGDGVIAELRQRTAADRLIVTLGAGHPDMASFARLVDAGNPDAQLVSVRPDDPAWLFYTSGTTGRPKGAILSHRNLLTMTSSYLDEVDAVEGEAVFLHAAPLTHGSGLYLLPGTARGATHAILDAPRFTSEAYLAAIAEHSATHGAFLAPTMLKRLVDGGNPSSLELATLRSIVVGGAPLYARDLADARQMFGPIITQIYGQGEAPMTITVMPGADRGASSRPRSTGRAFKAARVEIRNTQGDAVSQGDAGEVCVRGDMVMSGYWGDPDATAAALRDGWLHTGDVGFLDSEGYLFLTDRIKDVIITGGSNVYPREVEEALLRHPRVAEVSVFGIPDADWGESVCAVVVAAEGTVVSEPELLTHCQTQLASFKKPRRVIVAASLPKNAAGKVLKRELRELALN
jgi:acyl-CoA synthetase (AMP-forming)/AMP-acid ligase II